MTSREGLKEWGEVLGQEVMAAAPTDRILHHCHIVNVRARIDAPWSQRFHASRRTGGQ
jgi:DNA replication protein DnaC